MAQMCRMLLSRWSGPRRRYPSRRKRPGETCPENSRRTERNWTNGWIWKPVHLLVRKSLYHCVPVPAVKQKHLGSVLRLSLLGGRLLNKQKHRFWRKIPRSTKSTRMALALPGVWATQGWRWLAVVILSHTNTRVHPHDANPPHKIKPY